MNYTLKPLKDTDEIKNTTPYIGFVDVIDRTKENPVKLTIADVEDATGVKIDGVRDAKSGTYALSFKGTDRKLILQGRKKKHLIRQFGKKKSDWIGKEVQIYGDPNVTFGREKVGGVKFVGME